MDLKDEEKTRKSKVKTALFETIYSIETAYPEFNFVNIIIVIIETAQMIFYPFRRTLKGYWDPRIIFDIIVYTIYLINPALFTNEIYEPYTIEVFCFCGLIIFTYILFGIVYFFPVVRRRARFIVIILKALIKSFATFLYIPSVTLLTNISRCKSVNGVQMFLFIANVKCWEGIHLVWTIFASICLPLVIGIGFFYSTFAAEINCKTGNLFAKNSNETDLFNMALKTLIGLSFLIIDTNLYLVFSLVFIAINFWYLYKLKYESPYYNLTVSHLLDAFAFMPIWSGTCLFLGMIAYGQFGLSSSVIFIIDLPLILIIPFFFQKSQVTTICEREDFLSLPNPKESFALMQLSIFQKGTSSIKINRNILYLFSGYTITHIQNCKNNTCRLCKKEYLDRFAASISGKTNVNMNEEIINYLKEFFKQAIDTFPHFHIVKILYLLFTIEQLKNPSQAFSFAQIMESEKNLGIWVQYILYKYIKILADNVQERSVKIKDAIYIKQQIEKNRFKKRLIEATNAYLQLWTMLNCQQPKFSDIESTIMRILHIKNKIRDQMKTFETSGFRNIQLFLEYSEFVGNVLGDFKLSHKIKIECQQFLSIANSVTDISGFHSISNLQSRSVVEVFTDKKKLGIIKDCNMSFCKWYGNIKASMVGLNIDMLIPHCLQKHHRKNLSVSVSQEAQINAKQFVLILNSSGYLCPLEMQLGLSQESSGNPSLVCSFYPKKMRKKISAYLLFDSNLILRNISDFAVTLLGLDQSEVNSKHFHLSTLFPSLNEKNLKQYLKKKVIVNYKILDGARKYFQATNYSKKKQISFSDFNRCSVTINCFKFHNEEAPSAYYLMVREYCEHQQSEETSNVSVMNNKKESQNPETQFIYSNQFGIYIRNFFPGRKCLQKGVSMELMEQGLRRVFTLKGQESEVSVKGENIIIQIESFCNTDPDSVLGNLSYLNWIGPKVVEIHARLSSETKRELEALLQEHFFKHYVHRADQIISKRIKIENNESQFVPIRTFPGVAEYTYRSDLLYCTKEDESSRQKVSAKASVIDQDYRATQILLSDEDLLGQIFERHQSGKYFIYLTLYFFFIIILHLAVELGLYFNINNQVDQVLISAQKIVQTSRRSSEILDIQISILSLICINEGKLSNFRNRTQTEYVKNLSTRMASVYISASNDTTDQYVELTKMSIENFNLYSKNEVQLIDVFGNKLSMNFQHMIMFVFAMIHKVISMPTENLYMSNNFVNLTLGENQLTVENILLRDNQESLKLVDICIKNFSKQITYFNIFVNIVCCLLPLGIFIGAYLLQKEYTRLLQLFLSISSSEIQDQSNVTESTLNYLTMDRGNDIDIEEIDQEAKEGRQEAEIKSEEHKEHHSHRTFQRNYFCIFLTILFALAVMAWQSVASTAYLVLSYSSLNEFENALIEFNITGFIMVRLDRAYFHLLQAYKDASSLNYTLAKSRFKVGQNCIGNWEKNHIKYDSTHFSDYNNQFAQITKSNLCPYLSVAKYQYGVSIIRNCSTSLAEIGGSGLYTTLTYVLDLIREKLEEFGEAYETYSGAELRTRLTQILNQYKMTDIYEIMNTLSRPVLYYLTELVQEVFENTFQDWNSASVYLLILEIVEVIILFGIVIVMSNKEYNNYNKYMESLSIVPVRIRVRNQAFIDHVKKRLK